MKEEEVVEEDKNSLPPKIQNTFIPDDEDDAAPKVLERYHLFRQNCNVTAPSSAGRLSNRHRRPV